MKAKEIVEFILDGANVEKIDGINYYTFEWQEIYEIAESLVKKLNLPVVSGMLPSPISKDDIEQIEMIIDMQETDISEAHKQQYCKQLYEWYKKYNCNYR